VSGIEASHYQEARNVLAEDPIVWGMLKGLEGVPVTDLAHGPGEPRFEFMMAANREYAARGGTNQAHIGAVAEVILTLLGH
jgi:hypothetical protein